MPETTTPRRQAPLDMDAATFREAGHELVETIAGLLETLPERPVTRGDGPATIRGLLPADRVPAAGADAGELLRGAADLLIERSLYNGHPRFFGYITASAAPIGALADLLAASINPNLGGWQLSPVASEIEAQTVRWIGELLGYPAGHGTLTSGGNLANLTGFWCARRTHGGAQLARDGVDAHNGRMRVYASAETHTWIQKAADLSGLGTDAVRSIPTTDGLRVDPAALRAAIERDAAAGERPFLIVGTAGSVSTGAVDDLNALADLAEEFGCWFHVDGAYGAFARIVPEQAPQFAGLERADSLAVDPHKWLYAPIEAGCVLVKRREVLAETFGYTPVYYNFSGEEEDRVNYYEVGIQNSRGFRSLKVWLAIRQAGREGYERMIADDIRLTRELERAVGDYPELEPGPGNLSIATFRYRPPGERDEAQVDAFNERLLARLKEEGETFLSNAQVGGRFLLRACIVNFRTEAEDVRALPEIVVRTARRLHG